MFMNRLENNGQQGLEQARQEVITPWTLLTDNYSQAAGQRRREFNTAEENKTLILVKRCSDARYLLRPNGIITLPAIGAGGPQDPYHQLYEDPSIQGILVLPHVNCGGLNAKENQNTNGVPEDPRNIDAYIKDHIFDADPVIQAAKSAWEVSLHTRKVVLAAVHNHSSGMNATLIPYLHGKPLLDGDIPDYFIDVFRRNATFVEDLHKQYPNLEELQSVQNPRLLSVSENRRPIDVTLPQTTKKPGSTFRIRIPKSFDPTFVIDQAHYPISYSIQNHKQPNTPFEALGTLMVETRRIDESRRLAKQFMERPWMQEWIQLEGHQIIVARTEEGIIKEIDYFVKSGAHTTE